MSVFLVEGPDGSKSMVEARTKVGAIRHVALKQYKAERLSTGEALRLSRDEGLELEIVYVKKNKTNKNV